MVPLPTPVSIECFFPFFLIFKKRSLYSSLQLCIAPHHCLFCKFCDVAKQAWLNTLLLQCLQCSSLPNFVGFGLYFSCTVLHWDVWHCRRLGVDPTCQACLQNKLNNLAKFKVLDMSSNPIYYENSLQSKPLSLLSHDVCTQKEYIGVFFTGWSGLLLKCTP